MNNLQAASVIRSTRRWVTLSLDSGERIEARSASKAAELTVGDRVHYEKLESDYVVTSILPRRNYLSRKNNVRSKIFAANVDQLFIITAPAPLFNGIFIDRALVIAADQDIPATLVVNKIDLAESDVSPWALYRDIGCRVIETSATTQFGMEILSRTIFDEQNNWVAFCGFSGVGKSSLLNVLMPRSMRRVGELSGSGQGKQTTTQAEAFSLARPDGESLYLIDLPGFSQLGLAHISKQKLASYFPEFSEPSIQCDFLDCSHRAEPQCGVKNALSEGRIALSRYQSYVEIRHEIELNLSY